MNEKLTEIIFVLDKSGSMWDVKNDTIGGFNSFIKDQKELPGEAVFTFVTFDTKYNKVEQGTLLENVKELSSETYTPGGGTALFDAVSNAINDVISRHDSLDEDEKPGKTILVVLTDGEENSSREIRDVKEIGRMVAEREDAGWEVLFLGADLDNWGDIASGMGFSKFGNTSKADMTRNIKGISNYTAMYRSAPSGQTLSTGDVIGTFNLSEDELDKQMEKFKSKK